VVPVQVYLSEAEHAELRRLATEAEVPVATIVRGWIKRATMLARARERARNRQPPPPDPRQLTTAELG
jgi:hypothetical protein